MSCTCCGGCDEDREKNTHENTSCGTCHAGSDGTSGFGLRARREVRRLAIRFVASFLLFSSGLLLQVLAVPAVSPAVVRVIFLLAWLIAGYRVVFNALRNSMRGDFFDENFLMTVATVGAFLIGQWSEGAAVMLFYNLGEMVQESAVSRSRRSITALMDVRPDTARLAGDNSEVHPSEVYEGTLIRVLPGEKVPLDGMIVEGASSFDTSRLTGESLPRDALPGEEALAGFVNGSGLLIIRTTAVFAETAAAKMLDLVENAQNRKARAEKLITSFARVYTPAVTLSAVLLALLPPLFMAFFGGPGVTGWQSFNPWISRALVFLVISCPCAFVISVPLGFFGGIGGAAKRGILVKGADYIDVLAKAKAVVFDKTGTLTRGVFRVQRIELPETDSELTDVNADQDGLYTYRSVYKLTDDNHAAVSGLSAHSTARTSGKIGDKERYVAALAAAAEFHSNHPIALAIRTYAESEGISVNSGLIGRYSEKAGYGVCLEYDKKELLAGSRNYLKESGIDGFPPATQETGTAVDVAYGGRYAGRIILDDEPKEDSRAAVSQLRALGIADIVMLTGDSDRAARNIAARSGITDYRAGVLPHEKVALFEEISSRVKAKYPKGTVLFVGDGINDAPVLARADAGIAMGGIGSDAAIEAADVVLMNDNPLLVAKAISSARWTRRIVMENIVLSFVIKVGFLALGAAGFATLWEAVFADVGVALLATFNSLRARK